jgi:hypothetical protein
MLHLPPAHHETGKRDSPNETKIKEQQNKTVPDSNSNLTKSMTQHNQIKELTTWFLTLLCRSPLPLLMSASSCTTTVVYDGLLLHHRHRSTAATPWYTVHVKPSLLIDSIR